MYYLRWSIIVFGICWQNTKSKNLPSYITACKRSTVSKTDCSLKSALAAIPHLIKGDSEYKLPSLNPVKIPKLELNAGSNLKMTLTDASLLGLETVKLLKLTVDPEAKRITSKFENSRFILTGQYEISGQILVLPITGTGQANVTLLDTEFDYMFDYEVKKKDGQEYANVISSKSDFIAKNALFQFDNLFNGNKVLGDNMNKVLNDNPQEVLHEIGHPLAKEVISNVADTMLSSILSIVPYDALMPI